MIDALFAPQPSNMHQRIIQLLYIQLLLLVVCTAVWYVYTLVHSIRCSSPCAALSHCSSCCCCCMHVRAYIHTSNRAKEWEAARVWFGVCDSVDRLTQSIKLKLNRCSVPLRPTTRDGQQQQNYKTRAAWLTCLAR